MAKTFKKLILHSFIAAIVCIAAFMFYFHQTIYAPLDHKEPALYVLKKGSSIKSVAHDLKEKGIINNAFLFELNARFFNNDAPFKAGEYRILEFTSTQSLTDLFQSGKTYQRPLTIPEGLTKKQIVATLNKAPFLTGEITSLPTEGHLLPQTYHFDRDANKQTIIDRMSRAHNILMNELWETYDHHLPFKTKEEAVILASIVERETGISDERPRVAGVFINRLRKGMKLQSDPTIIYPLSDKLGVLDRPLYRSDWTFKSPYNTYMNTGLPPTPIANPGEASLRAVFNPEQHDYIYFVADGTGGHSFAKTLAEHNANVAKWRAHKKANNIE